MRVTYTYTWVRLITFLWHLFFLHEGTVAGSHLACVCLKRGLSVAYMKRNINGCACIILQIARRRIMRLVQVLKLVNLYDN